MEAGSSRSGGMPQVRCSASASQNVPGVRYLQRPRSQGRQVCGSGQVNSFVSSWAGSIASRPLLLSASFIRFYGRCCTPRRRPIDKAASRVKYTMHMVFLFCDYPQVLLSALPPTARKGECEGGTFDGFPHSRSITRPQAGDEKSAEAPPAADEARRFRGSVPAVGRYSGREPADTTRLARGAAAPRHAHGHQNVPPARFSRCARALSSLGPRHSKKKTPS